MKADLHIHSTFSDGSESIGHLILMAKEKGLDAIAITDHDTVSHMRHIPKDAGISVVGGVEISSGHQHAGKKAHILGYFIQRPELLAGFTRPTIEARNRNSEKQAEILTGMGYKIDMDKLARADGKYLYKQHIMAWLVTSGQAPDMFGSFYKSTFKNGGVCAFDIDYPDVFDAVRVVKEAGGAAVLAHPGQQKNFGLIPKLVETGLDGLELNHYENDENDRKLIREYAIRYGLFLTGGSDYHGKYGAYPYSVGDFLSEENLDDFINRKRTDPQIFYQEQYTKSGPVSPWG